jgi:hypothetical protein
MTVAIVIPIEPSFFFFFFAVVFWSLRNYLTWLLYLVSVETTWRKTYKQQDKRWHYYNAYVQEFIENHFHAMHEIPRLLTLDFLPWIYFAYEKISHPKLPHYLPAVKVKYSNSIVQFRATMDFCNTTVMLVKFNVKFLYFYILHGHCEQASIYTRLVPVIT